MNRIVPITGIITGTTTAARLSSTSLKCVELTITRTSGTGQMTIGDKNIVSPSPVGATTRGIQVPAVGNSITIRPQNMQEMGRHGGINVIDLYDLYVRANANSTEIFSYVAWVIQGPKTSG